MGAQLGGAVVVAFDRVFRIQPEILEAVAEAAEQRAAGAGGKDVHAVAFRRDAAVGIVEMHGGAADIPGAVVVFETALVAVLGAEPLDIRSEEQTSEPQSL